MKNDFDWDEEDLVIRPQEATTIYLNQLGDVVIRQKSDLADADQIVVIPVDRIQQVINALNDYLV